MIKRERERKGFWNQVEKKKKKQRKKRVGWRQEWVYMCGEEKIKEKKTVWMKERKNNTKNKKLQFRNATTIFSQYFHKKS